MAVYYEEQQTDPWVGRVAEAASTGGEIPAETEDVVTLVHRILGTPDVDLMAEGYREFASEDLDLAEIARTANCEALPRY